MAQLQGELRKSPREFGLAATLWDGPVLSEYLRRRTHRAAFRPRWMSLTVPSDRLDDIVARVPSLVFSGFIVVLIGSLGCFTNCSDRSGRWWRSRWGALSSLRVSAVYPPPTSIERLGQHHLFGNHIFTEGFAMQAAIGYLRVSTREQGRSGLGLAAQRHDIEAFGAREGF